MNKKVNSVIVISAIATILFSLIILIRNLVVARHSEPWLYEIITKQKIYDIFDLLSYALLAFWAVRSQKKIIGALGSLFLFVYNSYFLIFTYRMGVGYSNIIVACSAPCASIILLIALLLKKRRKPLFVISLVILAIDNLLNIFTMIYSMLTFGFFDITWVCRGIVNVSSGIFFIALSIYILIDGKPFEKKAILQKEYIQKKITATVSIEDQLRNIKDDYDSGKITAEEYKEQRINILKKSSETIHK